MVGHGGSSAGSYLADPTSLIPSHCASIVTTSTLRVKYLTSPKIAVYVKIVVFLHNLDISIISSFCLSYEKPHVTAAKI